MAGCLIYFQMYLALTRRSFVSGQHPEASAAGRDGCVNPQPRVLSYCKADEYPAL